MEEIARGIVFAGPEETDRQSCTFPQICVLPAGDWICAFRASVAKLETQSQAVLITRSVDRGQSWTDPQQPFVPPPVDGEPGRFRSAGLTSLGGPRLLAVLCWVDSSAGSLPFFNEETEGLLDTRIFLARSEDGGQTWSAPEQVDTAPFFCPTPITGPVLALPNGDLVCQFELNKEYYDVSPWRHRSVMLFSTDGGKSWPEHAITSADPQETIFYWDQRPGILPDGRILDVFWTYHRDRAVYLSIHARESKDAGRTWSEMWDTGVPGQPAQPVSLADGRIAMVYVDRTGPPIIKLRTSADGGRTWPDDSERIIHQWQAGSQSCAKSTMQDAWAEMGRFSIGLPATALTAEGELLVVYYEGPHPDKTDIRWALLKPKE